MRLLIIEDEYSLADVMADALRKENYEVDIQTDGKDGFEVALLNLYDLIILDVMLPSMDGFAILKQLRDNHILSKIIMLTAKGNLEDKLNGLENGANDYIVKPFHIEELIARVHIQLKNTADTSKKDILLYQDLELNLATSKLKCLTTNQEVELVCKEFLLMEYLMINKEQILSKEQLYDKVWGIENDFESNNLEAYLSFLRKKIKAIGSIVTTKKDNSGGIMATGGGIIKASNLTVHTSGVSSAAIRSDRGGGTITVDGGTYETAGAGSPTIYSTADISVSHATLCATAAEGVVIEGKNSVSLDDVTLTDTNQKLNGKSTTYKNIFLYQSMSGDASNGTSSFTAKNSTITTNKGDTFYVTNTTAKIVLENNTIINQDTTGNFLRIQKDSWGNSGSNGGNVVLEMTKQKANGNIVVDSISTLEMSLKDSSSFEGSINQENQAKSIQLSLDKTSKIKLTADSYVTSFTNEDTTNQNIDFNGYHLYVNGKAIS